MRRTAQDNAFTLLEILVAVMVVGVMAAVAVPKIGQAIEKFRAQEAVHLIQTLAASQERYYLDNDEYYYVDNVTFDGLDVEIPSLQYFNSPRNNGSAGGWNLAFDRTGGPYRLYATTVSGPGDIQCTEQSGYSAQSAQSLCRAMGFTYKVSAQQQGQGQQQQPGGMDGM